MRCQRCNTRMISSRREEVEDIDGIILITKVVRNECPICSVSWTLAVPMLPGESANLIEWSA